jgi:peptide/nickel transport system substrate-binding protein
MRHHWFKLPTALITSAVLLALVFVVACGGSEAPPAEKQMAATEAPAVMAEATKAPAAMEATEAPASMEATKEPAAMEATKAPAAMAGPADHRYYESVLDEGKYGGYLIEGHLYETDRWSPWIGCCNRSIYVARNPFNLLVMRDPRDESQEKIIGDLATSWEWASDGNSVTFNLWEGATWTDGEPVTADDVVFSLDEMADLNKVRPRTRNIEPYYASSEAIDPLTVKVNTKFPNPAALLPFLTVDFMVIHPKHVLEPLGLDDPADHFDDPENVVGSGAFMYKTRELGTSFEVEKNPNYFKEGLPFLDGIKVFIIADKSRAITALTTAQIHFMPGGGWTQKQLNDLEGLLEGKGTVPYSGESVFRIYEFNYRNPPVDDPRVRKALYIAMDSKELVEIARLGRGNLGIPFFPNSWMSATAEEISEWPGFRYVDANGELYIGNPIGVDGLEKDPADLEMARSLLAEAGHPDGMTLKYTSASIFKEEALIMQEQWKKIGVDLDLTIVDTTSAANAEQQGTYEHMVGFGHGTNIIDPDDMFSGVWLPGGPRNALKYDDPRIRDIFERQKALTDQTERRAVIKEAEDILRTGEGHGRPMFWHPIERFVHLNNVKNMVAIPKTVQYAYQKESVWLEE